MRLLLIAASFLMLATSVLASHAWGDGRKFSNDNEFRSLVYRGNPNHHWPAFEKALKGDCDTLSPHGRISPSAATIYQALALGYFFETGFCVDKNITLARKLFSSSYFTDIANGSSHAFSMLRAANNTEESNTAKRAFITSIIASTPALYGKPVDQYPHILGITGYVIPAGFRELLDWTETALATEVAAIEFVKKLSARNLNIPVPFNEAKIDTAYTAEMIAENFRTANGRFLFAELVRKNLTPQSNIKQATISLYFKAMFCGSDQAHKHLSTELFGRESKYWQDRIAFHEISAELGFEKPKTGHVFNDNERDIIEALKNLFMSYRQDDTLCR